MQNRTNQLIIRDVINVTNINKQVPVHGETGIQGRIILIETEAAEKCRFRRKLEINQENSN